MPYLPEYVCQIWLRSDGRVEKGGGVQTDRQRKLQLYIVDATLLERLYGHFGISGTVLQWFKSHISNRQQRVHIDGSFSCPQDLHFGIPQGSVLGPFLFCLYTTSISQIITTHDVSHHMYADDTQIYIELSQSDIHKSRPVKSHGFPVSLTDFGNFSRLTAGRHNAHGYL